MAEYRPPTDQSDCSYCCSHTINIYIPYVTNADMEADPDPVMAISLNDEAEVHSCLQHTVQGEGVHPPPVQGTFSVLYVPGTMKTTLTQSGLFKASVHSVVLQKFITVFLQASILHATGIIQ